MKGKHYVFHAGRGLYEVRYKENDGIGGVGYFFSKREADKIAKGQNRILKGTFGHYNLKLKRNK